jgi:RNA polymerase sigma factor (sigma-70 family)
VPRIRDIARKEVRVDMGAIPDGTAAELLAEYRSLIGRIAASFPTVEADELRAVGQIAVMEAWVTHNPRRIPLRAWITQVVRWRIIERADGELSRRDLGSLELAPEPTTNGRHDPERTFMLEQIIDLLVYLPPRQTMIIDGRLRRETFEEIALTLGISTAFCHQEYLTALAQLREWVGFRVS